MRANLRAERIGRRSAMALTNPPPPRRTQLSRPTTRPEERRRSKGVEANYTVDRTFYGSRALRLVLVLEADLKSYITKTDEILRAMAGANFERSYSFSVPYDRVQALRIDFHRISNRYERYLKKAFSRYYSGQLLYRLKVVPALESLSERHGEFLESERKLEKRLRDFIKEYLTYISRLPVEERVKRLEDYLKLPDSRSFSSVVFTVFPELKSIDVSAAEQSKSDLNAPPLAPEKAPALWPHDKQPGDTPPAFIQRNYAPWLGRGLSRPDLKRLDRPLYVALSNWLRTNQMPADLDLPTLKEANDRATQRIEAGDRSIVGNMTAREAMRLGAALSRRIASKE